MAPSRDLTPESLRGSRHRDLTLGMAPGACTAPVGFHRFEPVDECDRSHSGQFMLPDKEFRYLRHFCYLPNTHIRATRSFRSAWFSMSPWRSDHIIASRTTSSGVWPLRILSITSWMGLFRCLPS